MQFFMQRSTLFIHKINFYDFLERKKSRDILERREKKHHKIVKFMNSNAFLLRIILKKYNNFVEGKKLEEFL